MKRLLIVLSLLLAVFVTQAQLRTFTMTPDTTGTIIGVDNATTSGGNMHKFTSPLITQNYNGGVYVYVTASGTHATDSTRVELWASMDGTNYFRLKYEDVGRPALLGYAGFYYGVATTGATTGYRLSSAGATAGWYWKIDHIKYRYLQARIYQLKAGSILTVNECKLHCWAD